MNLNNNWNGKRKGGPRNHHRGKPRGKPWNYNNYHSGGDWNVNKSYYNNQYNNNPPPYYAQRGRHYRQPRHNNYNPIPYERPLSPLPGSEEYTQRNIQQTSELIKRQLNLDGGEFEEPVEEPSGNVMQEPSARSPSVDRTPTRKKTKVKTKQNEIIDVNEIHDKIIRHISNLSHSRKMNLVNQGSAGYDVAIHQIQKQQRLELSRALRDMSNRTVEDTDCEVINAIIPDIGIKIEELPREVIAQLSSTLDVEFENTYYEPPEFKPDFVDDTGQSLPEQDSENNTSSGDLQGEFCPRLKIRTDLQSFRCCVEPEVPFEGLANDLRAKQVNLIQSGESRTLESDGNFDNPFGGLVNNFQKEQVNLIHSSESRTLESNQNLDNLNWSVDNNTWNTDNIKLIVDNDKLTTDNNKLITDNNKLITDNTRLSIDKSKLNSNTYICELAMENSKLTSDNSKLTSDNSKLTPDNSNLSMDKFTTDKLTMDNSPDKLNPDKDKPHNWDTGNSPKKKHKKSKKKRFHDERHNDENKNKRHKSDSKHSSETNKKENKDKAQSNKKEDKDTSRKDEIQREANTKRDERDTNKKDTKKEDRETSKKETNKKEVKDINKKEDASKKEIKDTNSKRDERKKDTNKKEDLDTNKKEMRDTNKREDSTRKEDPSKKEDCDPNKAKKSKSKDIEAKKSEILGIDSAPKKMWRSPGEKKQLPLDLPPLYETNDEQLDYDSPDESPRQEEEQNLYLFTKVTPLTKSVSIDGLDTIYKFDELRKTNSESNIDETKPVEEVKARSKSGINRSKSSAKPKSKQNKKRRAEESPLISTPVINSQSIAVQTEDVHVINAFPSMKLNRKSLVDKMREIDREIERLTRLRQSLYDEFLVEEEIVNVPPRKAPVQIPYRRQRKRKALLSVDESIDSVVNDFSRELKDMGYPASSSGTEKLNTLSINLTRYDIKDLEKIKEEIETKAPDEEAHAEVNFKGWTGSILVIKVIANTVLAGSDKGMFYFYNLTSGELMHSLSLSQKPITSLCVIKNDLYVGLLSGFIHIIDFNKRELLRAVNADDPIQCMESSWGFIFLGSHKGNLMRFDIKKEKVVDRLAISDSNVLVLRATQEGARRVLLVATRNSPVTVRDAMSGLLMRTMESTLKPTVYTLLFHNNYVYCGTSQHDVLVYSFQDGQLMFIHEQSKTSGVVCMSIIKNLLFVGCYNGNIYVYNTCTNKFVASMVGPGGLFLSMEIVGTKIVVGTKQNHFKSWTLPKNIIQEFG